MYDFYLGDSPKSFVEESKYLISIKRMLPRWCNSIPDLEFLCIAEALDRQGKKARELGQRFVAVETGAGASSLALAYYAMKYDGLAVSWDLNGQKASEIRTATNETLGAQSTKNPAQHWKFVQYASTSPYLGLTIMKDLAPLVHFSLHDSEHTWQTLSGELKAIEPQLAEGAVVAMDDASYTFLHTDEIYLNIQRKKHGLSPVETIAENRSGVHWQLTQDFLESRWHSAHRLTFTQAPDFDHDISIAYFRSDFEVKKDLGISDRDQLQHRFVAWELTKRKGD